MKLLNLTSFVILSIFLVECSTIPETIRDDIRLETPAPSSKSITSENIQIVIPNNWIEVKDNNEQLFDIWLVDRTANAVISFIPIHLDSELNFISTPSKFGVIEQIIISKKKSSGSQFRIINEEIIPSEYQMKSIRYLKDEQFQNTIIFGKNDKYYECLAYFHKNYHPSSDELEDLIEVQKQIVRTAILK